MIEKMKVAPNTNRGAENTSKYPLIIDWLTVSGHFTTFEEMIEFLGLKNSGLEFKECPPRCYSLLDLIKRVAELDGFNVSRIDIAQDVIDDSFSIDTLVKAYRKGNYTCRSKFSNLMQSQNDGIKGTSLYFGKQNSNCFINIYDKRAERGFQPEDMPNWMRIEIRLRSVNAQGFANKLTSDEDVGFFTPECLITI